MRNRDPYVIYGEYLPDDMRRGGWSPRRYESAVARVVDDLPVSEVARVVIRHVLQRVAVVPTGLARAGASMIMATGTLGTGLLRLELQRHARVRP